MREKTKTDKTLNELIEMEYTQFMTRINDIIAETELSPEMVATALITYSVCTTLQYTTNTFFGMTEINRMVSEGIEQYVSDFVKDEEEEEK